MTSKTKIVLLLSILILAFTQVGCDPERTKECEWTLMPEPRDMHKVEEGSVAVCARNFKTNRQRCRLKTTMEYAKTVYTKKFRLVDLQVSKEGKFPRLITDIKFCDPG